MLMLGLRKPRREEVVCDDGQERRYSTRHEDGPRLVAETCN